jgi:hypothetical protein
VRYAVCCAVQCAVQCAVRSRPDLTDFLVHTIKRFCARQPRFVAARIVANQIVNKLAVIHIRLFVADRPFLNPKTKNSEYRNKRKILTAERCFQASVQVG